MLNQSPLVTVGVASYNNSKYIYDTLESIRMQTYDNIELIIVDDGSVDNSVHIIEEWLYKFPKFNAQLIRHLTNIGVCAVCNTIVAEAKGEYLTIVGSDDLYIPEKIAQQVLLFSQLSRDYCLIYSDMYIIDEHGNEAENTQLGSMKLGFIPVEGSVFDLLISQNCINAPTVMMLTQVVREIGGYDENLVFEDWDMWLRLSKKFKFKFSGFISVKYRVISTSAWNSRGIKFYESSINLLVKHLGLNNKTDGIIMQQVEGYAQLIYKLNGMQAAKWFRIGFKKKPGLKTGLLALLATLNIPYHYYENLVQLTKRS